MTVRAPSQATKVANKAAKLAKVARNAASAQVAELPTVKKRATVGGDWRPLPLPTGERLSLRLTLASGQSFRWQETDTGYWCCVLKNRLYTLRQQEDIHYRVYSPSTAPANTVKEQNAAQQTLIAHLRLDVDFTQRLHCWSAADANFARCLVESAATTEGVRVLRLDPVEALVSFICSSNNHVGRISMMVQRLCTELGDCIGHVGEQPMHAFPALAALAQPDAEAKMRAWGFGYRARFLRETARMIVEERPGGEDWLRALSQRPYREAKEELLRFPGIGPKVADCICLFGLDMSEAVPVDTHLWRVAQRDYGLGGGAKRGGQEARALTGHLYDAVGDCLRDRFGNEAGWAHSVCFTAT
ncbi:DNA glycosylase [Thamnocephalis sphaerospora]|uniref:N-glycosylase/DNA lyase n=1 Tax=Thamnocephalis sphaerospora TaxID=78915 RepID=A0A4P9XSI2_9FUNG|nr:DNA glycosylase [Thamnocephalis sphaerospora]|eukprot:RKP09093.1 DNA glycosylase [Thamnocephalis sphaerospora]